MTYPPCPSPTYSTTESEDDRTVLFNDWALFAAVSLKWYSFPEGNSACYGKIYVTHKERLQAVAVFRHWLRVRNETEIEESKLWIDVFDRGLENVISTADDRLARLSKRCEASLPHG
jgi:hypothetical protein